MTSGHITEIGYDAEAKQLGVRFKDGNTYLYEGVPASVYAELLKADSTEGVSVGKVFAQRVRSGFMGVKQEV